MGLLAKATLLKGIMSGEKLNAFTTYLSLFRDTSAPVSFQNHMIVNDLYESITRDNPSMRTL